MSNHCTFRRSRCLALIFGSVMVLHPAALVAQRGQTSTLLRRLAEAIDGNRTGTPVFLVAETRFPNRVLGAFADRRQADSLSQATGGPVEVFGPFETEPPGVRPGARPSPAAAGRLGPEAIAGCRHDRFTSAMDTTPAFCAIPPVPIDDVRAITLQLQLTNGRTIAAPIPLTTDVLFLQIEAIDKFAIPYYSKVVGLDEALRMRNAFDAFYRR